MASVTGRYGSGVLERVDRPLDGQAATPVAHWQEWPQPLPFRITQITPSHAHSNEQPRQGLARIPVRAKATTGTGEWEAVTSARLDQGLSCGS
ncbi:hypothetical protein HOK021_34970 [Streptomyces hygroscopicus]|nr:hypothetical protein HOK021_34970 [Streptomyces hygroscopicus]